MTNEVVLITGASGFIGTALIARLIRKYNIIGVDKVLHKDRDSRVLWYKADISDKKLLNETFSEIKEKISGKIDYVFHLAAYYDMSNRKNKMYRETNENGTRYLLDNLINFNVNNFVFTSSTVVFKPTMGDDKLNEDSALSSLLYYGNSKIAAEKILSEYKEKIKVTIFSLTAVYSQDCRSIPLANQIAFIWRRCFGYRILPGKGDGGISYVHIEDVLDAFEKSMLMTKEIVSGSIFILSEEDHVSNNKLYSLIFNEIYGKQLNLIHLPKWLVWICIYTISNTYSLLRKSYFFKPWMVSLTDKKYRFNTDKAKKILEWQPRFQFEQYMKVIINNLKNNTQRWFAINKIY
ncbi:MAG: NAD-dependent epimerase/dehydratase [Candidatus Scalindua rubra]|uniref:NAD-dependent epimerase/dehydratase n=1 Tax=Candidatus Scalindua rubra TaxID=1872076 RepID=A0A1E3XAL8_9BACT|nr:MAG: NAD-dependent epimerase/dehydratase [Candidatus Scalindua rubra]